MLRQVILAIVGLALSTISVALDISQIPLVGKKIPYNLVVDGEPSVHDLLSQELNTQRKTNRQLRQFTKRNKIARLESNLLTRRLHAEGYYDAVVRFTLADERILYRVVTGELYRVQKVDLQLPAEMQVPLDILVIQVGDPLRAASVLAAQKALIDYLKTEFCLWEIDTDYEVITETSTHSAYLTFTVTDSPEVRFGEISLVGLTSIEESYLLARLALARGDCFKRYRIDQARLNLVQTNLLASVTAQLGEPADGEVPVTLRVVERRHRTLSAGGGFQTDEGFGVSLGWEHRNLMGRGQRFRVDAHVAENLQTINTELTIPHFRRNKQALSFYSDLIQQDTDAFELEEVGVGVELSRQIQRRLRGVAGAELAFSSIVEETGEDNFALFSLPLSLEYDHRLDPLDPRRGWVASISGRPYWDTYDTDTQFTKFTFAASTYHTFDNITWQPTFALRGALGLIDGAERAAIPANERFYVGGGGSVRGYPFQSLGPLNGDDPEGGLSFNELSFETRLHWGQHWGGVVFVDGGFAYEETVPQVGEDLLWGAGLGLRYYTSFAPIRFDIGVPLDKREGIDDDFQLYISIGQSF